MKQFLKKVIFRWLGKDPDAVVVSFAAGDPQLASRMVEEIRLLEPNRRHFVVSDEPGSTWAIYRRLRRRFRRYRIGLAPVLFTGDAGSQPLRLAAFLVAPGKVLAYNTMLERHHLRLRSMIASILFLRGAPLDRIWLRPKWLVPWKRDRSVYPTRIREYEIRPFREGRKRIAIVTPYFPFPLSHGGAVRIFYLLREIALEFDVVLLAFSEHTDQDPHAVDCARVVLIDKPRYREPRWSTMLPPEVHEYSSPAMREALARVRRDYRIDAVQVEYTALAPYRGDILVEHDVTFSLYDQVRRRTPSVGAAWDYFRWRRFERKWVRRYSHVVVMSEQDQALLASNNKSVIPNGVDLTRFQAQPEYSGQRLLFVGSFRHFPNIVAYRFFVEQVWPRLTGQVELTVVAGPDPVVYWREHTGLVDLQHDDRIRVLGFVSDVQPLYVETNVVLVPTLVSAGTNLKVLEALAMGRAVVSTSSGCAGLGLEHGTNIWVADSAEDFAAGIAKLLDNRELREGIAAAGRRHVERHFGWRQIGAMQRGLLRSITGPPPPAALIRRVSPGDLERILEIQETARESSQWTREDYLNFDCDVALVDGAIAGFLVSRRIDEDESEILNVAVHPDKRRSGVASELIRAAMLRRPGTHFLEVRESNAPARQLYRKIGFEEVGTRPGYYENPPETAIVMRIYS